ncbi:MAG: hypothetical protein P8O03_10415 [Ilumatobacter sp.]|nr:hypothetical protein [Ilumatobacter sp.]
MTTLIVSQNEWFAARSAVLAASPSETDLNHGVALITAGGVRWWTAWTDNVVATTESFEDSSNFTGWALISRRLVLAAAHVSQELDDQVTLDLSAGRSTISAPDVLLTLDTPNFRRIPTTEHVGNNAAHSNLHAQDFYRVCDIAGVLPAGVDPNEVEMPEFVLQISEFGIGAWVDWSGVDIPATRLDVASSGAGEGRASVNPFLVTRVLNQTDPADEITVRIPTNARSITITASNFTAQIRSNVPTDNTQTVEEFLQLTLFDLDAYLCGDFVDPYAGWSLTDIRALAMDPDPEVRQRATMSRWNWDNRVQVQFATDPEESVVLALLANADPGVDATIAIIEGPHVEAKRVLARRNLSSELLLLFLHSDDDIARQSATATLTTRGFSLETAA